VYYVNL